MFCNYDSAVEDLFNWTLSCTEACITLHGWLVKLMVLQSWHCLRLLFFASDLVYSVGHFLCSQIFWHISVSDFTVPSILLLISSEGMSSIPGNLPVFTGASTSPSVPADCPHFQWRTGWFVVLEPSVSSSQLYLSPQHPAHTLNTPSLSVISLLSLSSMIAALY